MNIVLAIFMCSFIHSECIAPYVFPEKYASHYECMIAGYEKSLSKMQEIGKKDINKDQIFFNLLAMKKKESLVQVHKVVPLQVD